MALKLTSRKLQCPLCQVAGGTDYLLHVAATDPTALHDFILEYFAASPVIQHAETSLVFQHLRGTNVLPAG